MAEVDAHDVVPLPMPVIDKRSESHALFELADPDMRTIINTVGESCGMDDL